MDLESLKKQDKKHALAIANYLIKRIETDQCLKEKIEVTSKTLIGCIDYCKNEARKQAEDGCAMIPDDEVYEWAVHYFLEDSIKESTKKKSITPSTTPLTTDEDLKKYNKQSSPKPKKETVKKNATEKLVEQLTLFDLDF